MIDNVETVANLTALAALRIGEGEVGHSVYVTSETAWYEAMRPGIGLSRWRADNLAAADAALDARLDALEALGIFAYRRVFDHADTDLAVAAQTAAIDLGSALPAEAIVLGVTADVTEAFTNSTDAFEADVGISGGDDDAYTAAILDIDAGIALLQQWATVFAGGVTLAVTFRSDGGDLDTLTAGTVEITVFYTLADITTVAAP